MLAVARWILSAATISQVPGVLPDFVVVPGGIGDRVVDPGAVGMAVAGAAVSGWLTSR